MAKHNLQELITEQLKDFDSPHFAEGSDGTLHGGTYSVNGYRFFHMQLVGKLQIKTAKGCTLFCSGKNGDWSRGSESRDIETKYSKSLQKGITEFDFALDKEDVKMLEASESIRIVFPKLFGKTVCDFTVNNRAFLQKVLK